MAIVLNKGWLLFVNVAQFRRSQKVIRHEWGGLSCLRASRTERPHHMRVQIVDPASVLLDPTCGLERNRSDAPPSAMPDEPMEESEWSGFDRFTIVYDISLSIDGTQLIAIGPPLRNLRHSVTPIVAIARSNNGSDVQLRCRIREHPNFVIIRMDVPRRMRKDRSLVVELSFGDLAHTQVSPVSFARSSQLAAVVTKQKDNDPQWIAHWLAYNQSIGFREAAIYDNGSSNLDEVVALIKSIDLDMSVTIFRWNFPFGPTRMHSEKFLQEAALNHYMTTFATAKWVAHFDIDEYLTLGNNRTLTDFLDELPMATGMAFFDSRWVENHAVDPIDSLPTALNQTSVRLGDRGQGWKWIARRSRTRECSTHWAEVRPFRRQKVSSSDAFFLHYLGLTTGWKDRYWRRGKISETSPSSHKSDFQVRNRLIELGFGRNSEDTLP